MRLRSNWNTQLLTATALLGCLGATIGMGAAPRRNSGPDQRKATYCNPVDLPYRFQITGVSRREAADPTIVIFRGEYWLFPSKSGGYWHSPDLLHWSFVPATGYPVELYAPTVMVMNDKLYLTACNTPKIFVTDNPSGGHWTEAGDMGRKFSDPDLFLDDDRRVYMYDCYPKFIHVTELDPKNGFKALRTEPIPESRSPENRGWEVPGDSNDHPEKYTNTEGPWMNKYAGKYYLQYAAPGTEYKGYADGVVVGENPMGPFTYAPYSPFSFKPTGFVAGAGHSQHFCRARWPLVAHRHHDHLSAPAR